MAYRKIGTFVNQVSEKNTDGKYSDVLGVSIEKEFMPSVANIIGTDLKKYNVVRKGRFAFNPMHVGRDKKLPVAMYKADEPALVSPAYTMFEVSDNEVDLNYLMLLFKTDIFDHLCWFYTDASVRGGLTWNDFANIDVDIPTLNEQKKIVNQYNVITDRINILNQINDNLHNIGETLFNNIYFDGEETTLESLIDSIETGSRPKGGAEKSGIPSIGAEKIEKFGVYNFSDEKYINVEYYSKMKNGVIKSKDILLYKDGAYTGKVTMALNNFPYDKCAINEHVFKINTMNNYAQFFLYFCLNYKENRNSINALASSKAAQPGLNQTELKSITIRKPTDEKIIDFELRIEPVMQNIVSNAREIFELNKLKNLITEQLF